MSEEAMLVESSAFLSREIHQSKVFFNQKEADPTPFGSRQLVEGSRISRTVRITDHNVARWIAHADIADDDFHHIFRVRCSF
jgi:hypothetical protein